MTYKTKAASPFMYTDEEQDCWKCGGDGYLDGDCTCGEDACCCLNPEPPMCDICNGEGVV